MLIIDKMDVLKRTTMDLFDGTLNDHDYSLAFDYVYNTSKNYQNGETLYKYRESIFAEKFALIEREMGYLRPEYHLVYITGVYEHIKNRILNLIILYQHNEDIYVKRKKISDKRILSTYMSIYDKLKNLIVNNDFTPSIVKYLKNNEVIQQYLDLLKFIDGEINILPDEIKYNTYMCETKSYDKYIKIIENEWIKQCHLIDGIPINDKIQEMYNLLNNQFVYIVDEYLISKNYKQIINMYKENIKSKSVYAILSSSVLFNDHVDEIMEYIYTYVDMNTKDINQIIYSLDRADEFFLIFDKDHITTRMLYLYIQNKINAEQKFIYNLARYISTCLNSIDDFKRIINYIANIDRFEQVYRQLLCENIFKSFKIDYNTVNEVIQIIEERCGSELVHDLKKIVNDTYISQEYLICHKNSWGLQSSKPIDLPLCISESIKKFESEYLTNNINRKLEWCYDKSTCDIRIGKYICKIYLTQLNDVLNFVKSENTKMFVKAGIFTNDYKINYNFTSETEYFDMRVKHISIIHVSEKKLEIDREHELQALIVRIMKYNAKIEKDKLINKCIQEANKRHPTTDKDILKNIASLISKEYMKEEDDFYLYLS